MWATSHRALDTDFRARMKEAKLGAEDQVKGGLGKHWQL